MQMHNLSLKGQNFICKLYIEYCHDENIMSKENKGFVRFPFKHSYLLTVCMADSEMFALLIAVQFMPCFWLSPATWNKKRREVSWSEGISSGKALTDTSVLTLNLQMDKYTNTDRMPYRQIRWGLRDDMEMCLCVGEMEKNWEKREEIQRSSNEWEVPLPHLTKSDKGWDSKESWGADGEYLMGAKRNLNSLSLSPESWYEFLLSSIRNLI